MKSHSFDLADLVKRIHGGELQIPDFQRNWVWSDEQIKSLLESVIRGFPINSIMLLECDAGSTKFSYKPISGVSTGVAPRYLILDGQQRLTSLYNSLYSSKPVEFLDGEKRYYYLDIKKAVDSVKNSANVDDMIISVREDKKLSNDDEYTQGLFPLNKIFNSREWIRAYEKFYKHADVIEKLADDFGKEIIDKVLAYKVVYIELEKTTPIPVVCKIFEKVNTGGTELTVFELLTAILAAYSDATGKRINLPDDWQKIQATFLQSPNPALLKVVSSTDFVTALTLLATYKRGRASCKRDDILNLTGADYLKYKASIVEGFVKAAQFLDGESIRANKYLPYPTQLIPLAAIFANMEWAKIKEDCNKIRRWYWCGVFGESYRAAQETRYGRDISEVTAWLKGGEIPKIINETQMSAVRLMSLKTRTAAAYKGIISIIFGNGAKDFIVGKNMGSSANYAESIDIHHIFPKKYCERLGIEKDKYDSIANKTPILSDTNKIIHDNAPSKYLNDIQSKTGCSNVEVDDFLESHFANATLCRADNFDDFIVDRAKKLLDEIEKLTGRKISDRDSQDIIDVFGTTL